MGNTDILKPQVPFYTRIKGGDVKVRFHFSSPGSFRKFLCKEKCEREKILIETTDVSAQSSRCSVSYEEAAAGGRAALTVSITQLEKSDTGRYRCGLGRASSPASLKEFDVVVIDGEFLKDEAQIINIRSSETCCANTLMHLCFISTTTRILVGNC